MFSYHLIGKDEASGQRGWREDGSGAKNTGCSCSGPKFDFQHLHGRPGEPAPSSGHNRYCMHMCTEKNADKIPIHIKVSTVSGNWKDKKHGPWHLGSVWQPCSERLKMSRISAHKQMRKLGFCFPWYERNL